MYHCVRTAAFSSVLLLGITGSALAQSTTSDPLGINAIEDPTLSSLRGQIGSGTNGSLGRPYGWETNVVYRDWLGNEIPPPAVHMDEPSMGNDESR